MKQTAQGLAALGRGPDTQLVHMAPSEVAGLQRLAQQHGGSLTVNPDTGLPEAGFLSSILPMVLGAGAMAIPGLQGIGAGWIGAGIGGLQALRTGSLQKGLIAGLGAYGGAGLAQGLMGAGTGALSSAAGSGAPQVAAESLVPQVAAPAATQAASGMTPEMLARGTAEGARGGADLLTSGFQTPPATFAAQGIPTVTPALSQAELAANAQAMSAQQAALINDQAAAQAVGGKLASTTRMGTLGAGLEAAGNAPGAFLKANAYPIGALGLSALAGMQPEKMNAPADEKGLIRPYTYSREKNPAAFRDVAGAPMSSKERRYFTDSYTALTPYKAPGAEYMASGGPVEEMSNANALGASTGFPQSDIRTGAYASPFQRPVSQNVVNGAQDAAVDPYTGQMAFADGGSVGGYTYDPVSQTYSKAGGQGVTTIKPPGFNALDTMSDTSVTELPPSINDYLTWEETTPEGQVARDARMTEVGKGIGMLAGLMPGPVGLVAGLSNLVSGRSMVPDLGVVFGTPQSYKDYQTEFARGMDPMSGPGTIGSRDDRGSNESSSGGGYNASDYGGYSGTETQSSGESYANAKGGLLALAQGGMSNLGDYSDGGRLLRGPGDGVSDDIPAMIGKKQPARLADGEFVVPARIVSELGNGSTEAGARKLYAMMDRVQKNRKKSIGKGKVAADSKSSKLLPA